MATAKEQEVKDMKMKRRTAKSKLTRISNGLLKLLDTDRELDEINGMLKEMNDAYKDLETKHEMYGETVEEDDKFMEEDAWMDECQTSFLEVSGKVRRYLKEKESPKQTSLNNNENSPQQVQGETPAQASSSKVQVQVERPKLPSFTGDVRDYTTFRSDFKHLIETKYSKRDSITILRASLGGKPLDIIKGLGNDYDAAWWHLDNIYGDPRMIADAVVFDLGKFRPLTRGEDARFCDLVHLTRRSFNSLQEVGRANDMDNNHMISLIERKLSIDDRKLWLRFIDREGTDASLRSLLYWMEMELKTRIRAAAPLRDSKVTTVSHISQNEGSGSTQRQPDFKCWLCESSDHWIDQCKKVLSKSQEERFQLMKENRACFSCLKRAGKDHNLKTCRRRKRCNEKINTGEQCSSFHHPLLHRQIPNVVVDIAIVTATSSILPVLKVKMLGQDSRSCKGNCLLDSGAQMSLVKNAVADELGLNGRPIEVNVVKVGGCTEKYRTKLYQMKVQGIDSTQIYSVSAVGLNVINDSITEVNVKELAQIFNLRQKDLNRGSGPIDLLIGIDHPRVHTGQTKLQGKLVARHSPLGWVVFGKSSDSISDGAVLHITLSNPVEQRDLMTPDKPEGIGVRHDPQRCEANGMTKRDVLLKGMKASELKGAREHGTDFLQQARCDWPHEVPVQTNLPDVEKERCHEKTVLAVSYYNQIIDYESFSNWRKLVKVTALVLKFVKKLKSRQRNHEKGASEVMTPAEIEEGERYVIKDVQRRLESRIKKGELKSLSPFIDDYGVIRVEGRVNKAITSFDQRHPALLPYGHRVSMLIMRHIHEEAHNGIAAATAKARQKYRILKGHTLAKTVKFRCTACRAFEHRTYRNVDDIVMMTDANSVRGKWTKARVVQVSRQDGRVRNVKLKTMSAEYRRPVTKFAKLSC